MADRINAQQVHEQFLIVLEKLSTLKPSKAFHQPVTDFVIKTESNIERTNSGDSKALDEARNYIRWMEALYPFRPEQCKDENISFGDEQLTEEHARPSGRSSALNWLAKVSGCRHHLNLPLIEDDERE